MGEDGGSTYTPEKLASYFVDQMRNNETNVSSRFVLHDYFQETKQREEDEWSPDLASIATYLHSDGKTSESEDREEQYWDRLSTDLAEYLEDEFAFDSDATETMPVVAEQKEEVDRLYAPGGRGINEDIRPDPAQDTWMTTIITTYDPENEDECYGMSVEYLGEKDAREAVRWLLEDDQEDEVARLMEKAVRFGYGPQLEGFSEELVRAGEQDLASELRTWAAGTNYHTEARRIHDGISSGLDAAISSPDE